MPLDGARWATAIKALVDEDTVAAAIKSDMDALQPSGDEAGPAGTVLLRLFVRRIVDAVADAVASASRTEIVDNAVVSVPVEVNDVSLQSYSTGGPPVATTGPLVATSLDGRVS